MTGWKTKTGAALLAAAGVLAAVKGVMPAELQQYEQWFKFAEAIFAAVGAAFIGYGIGHKVEKLGNTRI